MTNPFEDKDGSYFVLINEEGQHSLWPAYLDVPAGWNLVYGKADRTQCVVYIKKHWNDMMPNSLKTVESIGNGK